MKMIQCNIFIRKNITTLFLAFFVKKNIYFFIATGRSLRVMYVGALKTHGWSSVTAKFRKKYHNTYLNKYKHDSVYHDIPRIKQFLTIESHE